MTRDLTPALLTELGNPITTPAYFVEILFSTPLRLSSRGDLHWNGNDWQAHDLSISGLRYDIGSAQQSGNLVLGDTDSAISALILEQGIAGRGINVWKFYGVAPADGDPISIFAGTGDAVSVDEKSAGVNISLVQRNSRELYAPRRYQTRANGFSSLPVVGQVIFFNNANYKLERDRG
jgi:hypothetical protein